MRLHDFAKIQNIPFHQKDFLDHGALHAAENILFHIPEIGTGMVQKGIAVFLKAMDYLVKEGDIAVGQILVGVKFVADAHIEQLDHGRQIILMRGDDVVVADEKIHFLGIDRPSPFVVNWKLQNQKAVVAALMEFRPFGGAFRVSIFEVNVQKFIPLREIIDFAALRIDDIDPGEVAALGFYGSDIVARHSLCKV